MVGFYDSAPLDSVSLRAQGTDVIPSTAGQVLGAAFGEGLAENLTPRLFRSFERNAAETGVVGGTEFGGVYAEPEPLLQPDEANAQYGIKGALSFSAPVAPSVAKDLYDHKKAQLEREDTIARREGGLLQGGAARFSASMAAGFLDPLNIAAGFIPVVGEAREAALIARAAGAVGRAGVRAGIGAAQGALGMAALQPLEFALSRQEQEDYTMATALRSIALGGVLGGGLHAGIGAIVDRAARPLANPLAERIEAVGPEARETLLNGALAQTIEGRPVNVAPAFDALEAARAPVRVEARTPESLAAQATRRPADIIDFLRREGGVQPDEGGELRAMDLHKPIPGKFGILVRQSGLTLDHAREIAEEAGYLPPGSTINDLLNALRDTQQGRPVYRPEEAALWAEGDAFHPDNLFGDLGPEAAPARTALFDTVDAARQQAEPDAVAMRQTADIQARAPEPAGSLDEQIAEAQRHVDAVMRELQPETAEVPQPRDEGQPAQENVVANIPELREADEMVARAEGDARAYEAAANCIAEKGL